MGLAQIWNLSNGEKVAGTVLALDTFLGVLLKLSSNAYDKSDAKYDGQINVGEDDTSKTFTLVYHGDPDKLDEQDQAIFKINKEKPMKTKVTQARKRTKLSKRKVAE